MYIYIYIYVYVYIYICIHICIHNIRIHTKRLNSVITPEIISQSNNKVAHTHTHSMYVHIHGERNPAELPEFVKTTTFTMQVGMGEGFP